jgi:hypothetical protein
MAIGPLARLMAQLVVPVVAVLARAIPAAYGQALQNARKAGVDAAEASAPVFGKRISRSEALQILNLTEAEAANPEVIQKVGLCYGKKISGSMAALFNVVLTHIFRCLVFVYRSNSRNILPQMMYQREVVSICNPKFIEPMNYFPNFKRRSDVRKCNKNNKTKEHFLTGTCATILSWSSQWEC